MIKIHSYATCQHLTNEQHVDLHLSVCSIVLRSIGLVLTITFHRVADTHEFKTRNVLVWVLAASLLCHGGTKVRVDSVEDSDTSADDLWVFAGTHVSRDCVGHSLTSTVVQDTGPEVSWLVKVLLHDGGEVCDSISGVLCVDLVNIDSSLVQCDRVNGREVIWTRPLVVECRLAISLEVTGIGHKVLVYGQLLVV